MVKKKVMAVLFALLIITTVFIFKLRDTTSYQAAPLVTPEGATHSAQATSLLKEKKFDKAIEEINMALETSPEHAGWHFLAAMIYFHKGDYNELKRELALTTKYRPNDFEAYFMSGLQSFKEAKKRDNGKTELLEEARRQFDAALMQSPEHMHTHYFLGQMNLQEGRTDEATANFKIATKHNKHRQHMIVGLSKQEEKEIVYMSHFYLGEAYLASNKLEKAIKELEISTVGGVGGHENFALAKAYIKNNEIEKGLKFSYRSAVMFYQQDKNIDATINTLEFIKKTDQESEYIAKIEEMMKEPPMTPKKKKRRSYY